MPCFHPFFVKHKEWIALNLNRILKCTGSLALTGLLAALTALPCAALEENETVFPGDEPEEIETFDFGEYQYSILMDSEDSTKQAACIEHYKGSETDLVIPEEMDGLPVVALGDHAFVDYPMLQTVTLPKTLVGVGTYTFANCRSLREYIVPEDSEYFTVEDGVLYGEEGGYLVRYPVGKAPKTYTVKEGVFDIGCSAFACCDTLESVTLPDSLLYLGEAAFTECTALKSVTLPDGIEELEAVTFFGCTALESVTMPAKLTKIGAACFARTAIKEVTLPDTLTSIGQAAFAATALKEVTIPASVTEIGYSAFGWNLNAREEFELNSDFVIHGYAGSAAQTYASDAENGNSFAFEPVDAESKPADNSDDKQPPVTVDPVELQEDDGLSTGRVLGIIGCCAALVAIVCFVIASVVRGKKQNKGGE